MQKSTKNQVQMIILHTTYEMSSSAPLAWQMGISILPRMSAMIRGTKKQLVP